MSTKWISTVVVVAMACFAFAACDDNPVNENTEDTVGLSVNPTFAVVDAADTTRVEAVGRNAYRQPTRVAVSFTACDAKILVEPDPERVAIENPERTLVIGQTLGETCVNASGAGQTASAVVNVVPSDIEATMPSSVGSGASAAVTLTYYDKAGDPVTGLVATDLVYSVDDPDIASVDASGNVTGKAPGTTTVTAALAPRWGAPRSGESNEFSVEPGTFDGTVPAATDTYDTITVLSGSVDFDDDTDLTFDGYSGVIVESDSATYIDVVVPPGFGASPGEVLIFAVGPDQLAYADTIDVPTPCAAIGCEDPNDSRAEATAVGSLPWEGWLVVGDEDLVDYFAFDVSGGPTVDVYLWWADSDADFDVIWYEDDGGGAYHGCGTGSMPENCSWTLDGATTTLYLRVDVYSTHGNDYLMTYLRATLGTP